MFFQNKKFAVGILVLLALAVGACGGSATLSGDNVVSEVPTLEPTSTVVPTSTSMPTPTQEPTATVVEFAATDQERFLQEVFTADPDCKVTYEVEYNPKYANSLPWTVDENGDMVQGITSLDLCGTPGQGPYLAFFKVGDGWFPMEGEVLSLGRFSTDYYIASLPISHPALVVYEGFLAEDALLEDMQDFWVCVFKATSIQNGISAEWVENNPMPYPAFYIPISGRFAEAWHQSWFPPTGVDQIMQECHDSVG